MTNEKIEFNLGKAKEVALIAASIPTSIIAIGADKVASFLFKEQPGAHSLRAHRPKTHHPGHANLISQSGNDVKQG